MTHRDAFNDIITFGFIQKAKSFLPEAENLPGIFGGGHFTKAKELAGQASKVRGAGDRIGAMSRIAQARKEVYKGKIEAGVAGLGVAGSAATLGGTAYAVAHARKKEFKAELRDIIEFAFGKQHYAEAERLARKIEDLTANARKYGQHMDGSFLSRIAPLQEEAKKAKALGDKQLNRHFKGAVIATGVGALGTGAYLATRKKQDQRKP